MIWKNNNKLKLINCSLQNTRNRRAGGFRTLLVTNSFTVSYKKKNLEVKHRSNILRH